MKKTFLIFILITGMVSFGYSQIQQTGEPLANEYRFSNTLRFVSFERTSDEVFQPETDESQPTALYAGFIIPFEKPEMLKGCWESVKQGINTWRIGITRKNAKALNVYFKDFLLQEDEQLFVYNQDRSVVLGAFTNRNNGEFFATQLIFNDAIIIEFNTPFKDEVIPFEIRGIGISVLDDASRDFGDAGFCEIPINCPEGDSWQNEKRGVARILVADGSKLYWCTGTLVNNTKLDATPYLITAKHCGENASLTDYANWVFDFDFETSGCDKPSSEPFSKTMSGSSLIAHSQSSTNSGSDFKLVLLDDDVPEDYKPYYNGWNRNGESSPSGVTIHHPEGDIKMISTYTDELVSTNYNNPTPNPDGKYWKVTWAETETGFGVTEGGSSGSPIFDPSGNVVGLLSGGRADCINNDEPDYYGKFSYSWNSNGTSQNNQLQPWLDPIDSGVESLKGTSFDTTQVVADFSSNATQIKVGNSVEFYNRSDGNITQYQWRFQGGDPSTSEAENPPSIKYSSAGKFDVGLYVVSENGNDSLVKKEYISVLPNLSPNPSTGRFNIIFGDDVPDDLEFLVSDAMGRVVDYIVIPTGPRTITLDLSQNMAGLYLVKIKSIGQTDILKAILINE